MIVDPANLNLPETASQEEILAATNFNIPDLGPEVFIWFVLFFLGGIPALCHPVCRRRIGR